VAEQATEWEWKQGISYYDRQWDRLMNVARAHKIDVGRVVAAFCILSPNNSEKVTYRALGDCIAITQGETRTVSAFGRNRVKALQVLKHGHVDTLLSGPKVTAFYHNTLDPDDDTWVTVDGHIYSAYVGERMRMTEARIRMRGKEYQEAADAIRECAGKYNLSAPRFQSTIWLVWKRIHRVLWSPQFRFEFHE
jgi:hypothetical protein